MHVGLCTKALGLAFLLQITMTPSWAKSSDKKNYDRVPFAISESGRKRVAINIATLEANLLNARNNLQNSQANVKTISTEIEKLNSLDGEVQQTQLNQAEYLRNARTQMSQNEKALSKLSKWKKTLEENKVSAKSTNLFASQKKADKEQANRKIWRQDANAKVARMKALQRETNKTRSQLKGRIRSLEKQLKDWNKQENRYGNLVKRLEKRLGYYRELAANFDKKKSLARKSPSQRRKQVPKDSTSSSAQ